MTILSSKLADWGDGDLVYYCLGCDSAHMLTTTRRNNVGARWTWDGNADAPTFSPSVHLPGVCHHFLRAGRLQYLGDSRHALAGQTVELPDLPDWMQD